VIARQRHRGSSGTALIRWAVVMIRLCAAWRKTSVNRTTGTAPDPMRPARTWTHGRELIDIADDTVTSSSRWMVFASYPLASIIRLAVRPVGAQSSRPTPLAARIHKMALTMVLARAGPAGDDQHLRQQSQADGGELARPAWQPGSPGSGRTWSPRRSDISPPSFKHRGAGHVRAEPRFRRVCTALGCNTCWSDSVDVDTQRMRCSAASSWRKPCMPPTFRGSRLRPVPAIAGRTTAWSIISTTKISGRRSACASRAPLRSRMAGRKSRDDRWRPRWIPRPVPRDLGDLQRLV
jgi:hypothetical protein